MALAKRRLPFPISPRKQNESFELAERDSFDVDGQLFIVNRIVPTTDMEVGRLVGWVELHGIIGQSSVRRGRIRSHRGHFLADGFQFVAKDLIGIVRVRSL